jgi:hypothetical protein
MGYAAAYSIVRDFPFLSTEAALEISDAYAYAVYGDKGAVLNVMDLYTIKAMIDVHLATSDADALEAVGTVLTSRGL